MSYRITNSIIGSLTLTSCGLGNSEQWQGKEVEQSICLDAPSSYDNYGYYSYYDDYYCQNFDVIQIPLPVVQEYDDTILSQQYFLNLSGRLGTLMIQQTLTINNREYTTSYFLQARSSYRSGGFVIEFGYESLDCQVRESTLNCSWYNNTSITFEKATSDMMIFSD